VFPFSRGRLQDRQFRYRLFRPQRDPGLPDARYPLLVWASGYGEMGDDNFAQLRHLQFVFTDPESGRKKPFYCLVLQSPADLKQWFDAEGKASGDDVASVLLALVERIMKTEPIDPERVYLSGISAGGGVCWELLERRPDLFAAVAPLAGPGCGSDRAVMAAIRGVPVWAFHAARDPLLPATSAQETIAALRAAGGSAALTEVDADYHDCWTAAFRDWKLMDWLLLQRRGKTAWLAPPGRRPIDWPVVGGIVALLGITAVAIRQELKRQRRSR
jgi:dienelactone hydrolase